MSDDAQCDVTTNLRRKLGLTAREACVATGTARQYTRRFTDMELLREEQVSPRYLYQRTGSKAAYVGKLKAASRTLEGYDGWRNGVRNEGKPAKRTA